MRWPPSQQPTQPPWLPSPPAPPATLTASPGSRQRGSSPRDVGQELLPPWAKGPEAPQSPARMRRESPGRSVPPWATATPVDVAQRARARTRESPAQSPPPWAASTAPSWSTTSWRGSSPRERQASPVRSNPTFAITTTTHQNDLPSERRGAPPSPMPTLRDGLASELDLRREAEDGVRLRRKVSPHTRSHFSLASGGGVAGPGGSPSPRLRSSPRSPGRQRDQSSSRVFNFEAPSVLTPRSSPPRPAGRRCLSPPSECRRVEADGASGLPTPQRLFLDAPPVPGALDLRRGGDGKDSSDIQGAGGKSFVKTSINANSTANLIGLRPYSPNGGRAVEATSAAGIINEAYLRKREAALSVMKSQTSLRWR